MLLNIMVLRPKVVCSKASTYPVTICILVKTVKLQALKLPLSNYNYSSS